LLLPESAADLPAHDKAGHSAVRFMSIPPFERQIEIADFDFFVRSRLNQAIVVWPEQAIALVGYMVWPNDPAAREASKSSLRAWSEGSLVVPPRLRQIQSDWSRVADIFNLHSDLTVGGHQQRRGGPSVGKAVALGAASIRSRGARATNLWRTWKACKDVAHLVTAATIVSADALERAKLKPFGEFGLASSQLQPFPVAMLMPDFVISLALSLQEYGLAQTPRGREEPMLDPKTLWRIRPDVNVVPVPPPARKINRKGIAVLNARRAGNRGKSKR
jgi:hypothetical protein